MKKHLDHLSMLAVVLILCLTVVGIANNCFIVSAKIGKEPDVIINAETEKLYTKQAELNVYLIIKSKDLINENIYLSYHIKNRKNEVIQYENERIPINMGKNGEKELTVLINLEGISNKKLKEGAIVEFDIVDEEKMYWFSTNELITLDADCIIFENNYLMCVYTKIINGFNEHKIIFCVNLLCCLALVIGIHEIKKRHIFE